MITRVSIQTPQKYLNNHLKHADYYSENETVEGEWIGRGAEKLELGKGNFEEEFEAVGEGKAPNGEELRQRTGESSVSYHDIGLSVPKDYSVAALVGGDERLEAIFAEEARNVVKELEKHAARRLREGEFAHSEKAVITGNLAAAMFIHQSSRTLDPQLHAHLVVANATYDEKEGKWYSLQPKQMMEASIYIRQQFYNRLAHRIENLGYRTHEHTENGFSIRGFEQYRDRFSTRTKQIEEKMEQYRAEKGVEPSKKAVAMMSLDTRDRKLAESSRALIKEKNLALLSPEEREAIQKAVENNAHHEPTPIIQAKEAVNNALVHEFERNSTTDVGKTLKTAFRLSPALVLGDVHGELLSKNEVLLADDGQEFTTKEVITEEIEAIKFVEQNLRNKEALGSLEVADSKLDEVEAEMIEKATRNHVLNFGIEPNDNELKAIHEKFSQDELRQVAKTLLTSPSQVSVLIGDAGTGKTFGVNILQDVHLLTGGEKFEGLAPTGLARKQLQEDGIGAQTLQRFLVSQRDQAKIKGRTVLLDEAGLVGTKELGKLLKIVEKQDARLVLVGDVKQHESVTRGNALRNLTEGVKGLPVARLETVRRQSKASHAEISELLSKNKFNEAIEKQIENGQLVSAGDKIYDEAAKEYASQVKEGKDTLVVIPVWDEIDKFTELARAELRVQGLLGKDSIQRTELKSRSFTEEEKGAFKLYEKGNILVFNKSTKEVAKGEFLEVEEIAPKSIKARNEKGELIELTRKQRKAFDVMEARNFEVSTGDMLMLRANISELGENGDLLKVKELQGGNLLVENKEGKDVVIPAGEKRISYGHAVTSHRSQGQSRENTISVMGEKSIQVTSPKQYYVTNTRYKSSHKIFVRDKEKLRVNLARRSQPVKLGRELKTKPQEKDLITAGDVAMSKPKDARVKITEEKGSPKSKEVKIRENIPLRKHEERRFQRLHKKIIRVVQHVRGLTEKIKLKHKNEQYRK